MSMKINGKYSQYPADYARRLEEEREKVKEPEKEQNGEKTSVELSDLHDEYISSEKSGVKPSGLYRLGQDEDGRKKVFFDDPKKTGKADENGNPKAQPDNSDKAKDDKQPKVSSDNPEKCTTNTDKVDREIEKLKDKQQQLKQQIQSASEDEKKIKELEKKLAQVESELSQKDNDTYRRQNASIFE